MIPEKIRRPQLPLEITSLSNESNRTHSLSVTENGKFVGKFIYDRLSSAVSLIHELKVLAKIKFTQLEIVDGGDETPTKNSVHQREEENRTQPECNLVQFDQIRNFLRQQLDKSRQAQMPCTLVLLTALYDQETALNLDNVLIELSAIAGNAKGHHDQLFWYPLGDDMVNPVKSRQQGKNLLGTGFCLILPSSGLIKARLLVNEIQKKINGSAWPFDPMTICAGIGVKTLTDISEDGLLAQVNRLLNKSILNGGKTFTSTDTSSNSQVTVEERSQLFMISKKTL